MLRKKRTRRKDQVEGAEGKSADGVPQVDEDPAFSMYSCKYTQFNVP